MKPEKRFFVYFFSKVKTLKLHENLKFKPTEALLCHFDRTITMLTMFNHNLAIHQMDTGLNANHILDSILGTSTKASRIA